ncbi:MAG: hypothetical protein WAZ20_00490 [Methanothrix sp.]|jgi:hypothetical protein|nr:hypothetical protein [Methanothrix sp.]HPW72789.1 hypothetical protein [Methanothrix sp.]
MSTKDFYDRLGEDRGMPFTALAVHDMQISSGAIQALHLQGIYF